MIRSLSIITVAAMALSACADATAPKASASKAASTAPAAVTDARVTAAGTFVGKSDHITTGGGAIARQGGQWVVILANDFTFDGAPDPHVALGSDGYRKDAALAKLQSNNGQQVYAIPASLDVADFNEIWIWCDKFAVPLGVAKLSLT